MQSLVSSVVSAQVQKPGPSLAWHHLPGGFSRVFAPSLSLSLLIDSPGKLDGRFGGGILLAQGLFFDCSLKTGAVETFLIVAFIRLADEERRTLSSE